MEKIKSKAVNLIRYICTGAVCVLISGCGAGEAPVTPAPAVSGVTSSSAVSASGEAVAATDQGEEEKKPEWLPGNITPVTASDWEKAVDENKRHLFILQDEKTIIQVDKKTREGVPLVRCGKKDAIYFLTADGDDLYYGLNDNAIYQYNLPTGKTKQIYHTGKEPDSIFGMRVYKNDIYVYRAGLVISRLDRKTGKAEDLLVGADDPIFIGNKLFFIKHRDVKTVYCLDLDTGKKGAVRKFKNKEGRRFWTLCQYKGKPCHTTFDTQDQNSMPELCMLSEQGKKDTVLLREESGILNPVYSCDKDTLYYVYENGDNAYLGIYREGEKRRIQLPEDYDEKGCVCDGIFFYTGWNQDEEDEYYSNYISIDDKALKEK